MIENIPALDAFHHPGRLKRTNGYFVVKESTVQKRAYVYRRRRRRMTAPVTIVRAAPLAAAAII
jgi:hypothetical protein